jgi:hypothetical protein
VLDAVSEDERDAVVARILADALAVSAARLVKEAKRLSKTRALKTKTRTVHDVLDEHLEEQRDAEEEA